MTHFLVFGSHPRLSLAEYKAIRPNDPKPLLAGPAALVEDPDWNGQIYMNRLGGTVKLGDIIGSIPADAFTEEAVVDLVLPKIRPPSIDFGWTIYGGSKGLSQSLSQLAIPFKRALKAKGISSRWVTSENKQNISPAAIAKLKMTTEGADICLMPIAGVVYVGLTTDVQDADAWSLRDYGRPARDDKNGMLPPKLARMMVNLSQVPHDGSVLDPFCGSGTVCMEAALATDAAHIIGSDLATKQVHDSQKNQDWLIKMNILRPTDAERFRLFQADARLIGNHLQDASVDCVVTEGFLGPPLHDHESQIEVDMNAKMVHDLWRASLKALHPILKPHGRVVGAWPGYRTSRGKAHVDLENELAELGFELVPPLAGWEDAVGPLVYSRPDQHVTRRIVILRKA